MAFQVGDRVIHPQHGLGQVTGLVVKQFVEGDKYSFYEVSFPGSTLWVPLELSTNGMRRLAVKREIASCRRVLQAPAKPLHRDFRLRHIEVRDYLRERTLIARCEVVRDLTAYGRQKPLHGAISFFYKPR